MIIAIFDWIKFILATQVTIVETSFERNFQVIPMKTNREIIGSEVDFFHEKVGFFALKVNWF